MNNILLIKYRISIKLNQIHKKNCGHLIAFIVKMSSKKYTNV